MQQNPLWMLCPQHNPFGKQTKCNHQHRLPIIFPRQEMDQLHEILMTSLQTWCTHTSQWNCKAASHLRRPTTLHLTTSSNWVLLQNHTDIKNGQLHHSRSTLAGHCHGNKLQHEEMLDMRGNQASGVVGFICCEVHHWLWSRVEGFRDRWNR